MNDPGRRFAHSAQPVLRPFPPMRLGRATRAALWGLRIFSMLIAAMVVFTFLNGNRP